MPENEHRNNWRKSAGAHSGRRQGQGTKKAAKPGLTAFISNSKFF